MKSLKKFLVLLLSVFMVLGLAGCSGKGEESGSEGIDGMKNVKIGVLVADATGAEALAFRSYYENYIQKQYNVTFMYSDELADAAAESSAIDNFIANNCKAIISFASADRPAQIRKCAENKVYYAVATGTLSDDEYAEFKDNEYYVGAIGPDLYTEFQAGYNMAKYYLDQGKTKFAIFGGATPYYVDMHIYRTAGMLVAMCEAGNGDYNGAKDFGSMIGTIYGMNCQLTPAQIGSVELVSYVGGYDFDDAWFGKLAEAANNPNVEVLLAVGSGLDTFAAFKRPDQALGTVDSYTADAVKAMEAGTLNYLAGKFSASIGPIFMATVSAVQGKPIRTANGEALALSQGYWVATSAEEANNYFTVDSSTTDPAYTKAMLDKLYGASYDDFAKFVGAYSYEEIQNLKK
jgi:ABC-type sugar transport system substrate-binding protein